MTSSPELITAHCKPAAPECLTYSLKEAAEVLGVGYHTVARLIKRGKLKCLPGIRHKRIPRGEIARFMNGAR